MIVPIAAGSSSDVVGRLVAERMGTTLGQPIIIENVPGADGSIGVGRVARARPDGYTIEFGGLERIPLKLIHIRHEPGNCNTPGR